MGGCRWRLQGGCREAEGRLQGPARLHERLHCAGRLPALGLCREAASTWPHVLAAHHPQTIGTGKEHVIRAEAAFIC